ncbi:DotI/IcmL family type IV secretion protein [Acidithiobacillus ferriphilus]|uniref:DotI/IcmL family type IV secretion protein n=1 Tax=Acidithiobacillus TaxID=119977 RepID=UPI0018C86A43|nr:MULTISPECIES: DotI/IcmL family type IV secretion protein [Acidithiobacillus]MEB8488340.1 DotI/IcmL family type IV secretion protein [Acidithiobacillus ferriphilus]MEB8490679.1 DotI/IcmL family type IV secretion protein [Acidithiobacillus ferriphilus]MEB8493561.1 DotI/IcmL family type IV secretion protein [Acidithiobacillus ferriphilus]MEB8521233.1 DotI/IcmL family type IV secretion protein [Acidithiobacillus ferriphilus]MEB8533780.1 DotI/IcmL family type IV secretion protein [Acidithiobacil
MQSTTNPQARTDRLPAKLTVEPVELIGIGIAGWKRLWRLSFGTNIIQGVVNIGLVIAVVVLATQPAIVKFVAVNAEGGETPLITTNKPMMGDAAVLTFAQRAVEDSFSLGFASYRLDMQRARKFYSAAGWNGYLEALHKSHDLLAVRRRQLDMTVVVSGPPTVVRQGVQANGRYGWVVQMPVRLVFEGDGKRSANDWIMAIHLQRRSNLTNPYGIAIQHFRMLSAA